MNRSILYLIIGGVCVNGIHAYLLFTQKNERRWSISEHGIHSKKERALYMAGHFIGGIFLFLFAREFWLSQYNSKALFAVACAGVAFEYLQAIVPAKGRTNAAHIVLAMSMWFSYMLVGLLSVFTLDMPNTARLLSSLVLFSIVGLFVTAIFTKRDNFWRLQMAMISLYPVGLLLMQVK